MDKKEENYIKIGGFDGIKITLDKHIESAISTYIFQKVRECLEKDKDEISKQISLVIASHQEHFMQLFKPIIQDCIEDIDFKVNFSKD